MQGCGFHNRGWGDWFCCSLEYGWEGFGKMAFIWGQGQSCTDPSVGSPFCHRLQLSPALNLTQWLSWQGPGREGRTARGQSRRHLWTLPDALSGIRNGAKQGQLRGLMILWLLSQPPLFCGFPANLSFCFMQRAVLPLVLLLSQWESLALSSPNLLLRNVQLHRHCVLKETDSLTTHIIPPALGWCSLGHRKPLGRAPVLLIMKKMECLSCLFKDL